MIRLSLENRTQVQRDSIKIHVRARTQRETCVLPKGFEPEFFPLKFNPPTFEYKIHSVEVDLYYFKYL